MLRRTRHLGSQQAVRSKFALKYSRPYRVVDRQLNGVSYELEDPVTGARRKVNRANLKLYALPLEAPPAMPNVPPSLVGLPSAQPTALTSTRETAHLQADLPCEAEEVHLPIHESIVSDKVVESVPGGQWTPVPLQGSQRPLRPTLARRARAGDPAAHYHFVSV